MRTLLFVISVCFCCVLLFSVDNQARKKEQAPQQKADQSNKPTVPVVLAKLRAHGVEVPRGPVRIGEFGDSPELSASLLALIREGRKRAGTGLLWAYEAENESIEQMGEIEIVVDHRNEPAIITRFTQAPVVPYGEVSWAAYAKDGTQRSRQL